MSSLGTILTKTDELKKTIREYSSDTFDAQASNLTTEEAEQIAHQLVSVAIQSLIDLDHLDGVRISSILEDIRS